MNGDAATSSSVTRGESSQASSVGVVKNDVSVPSTSTSSSPATGPKLQKYQPPPRPPPPPPSQQYPMYPSAVSRQFMYYPMMLPLTHSPCQVGNHSYTHRYPMPAAVAAPYMPAGRIGYQSVVEKQLPTVLTKRPIPSIKRPLSASAAISSGSPTPEIVITYGAALHKKDPASPPKKKPKLECPTRIIDPDWDFSRMGIGGLDKQFSDIFRRAFASRVFPVKFTEQLGMKHVRGILLYGPPGTGKTLIARQIGKMLNAHEPKVVNGPEIFHKWLGESEANMRKLFADAERDWLRFGSKSGLHVIIFDELDAICKQRGSNPDGNGVGDKIVNQLLSKMDGFQQLNNILVIGMTNRRDMIDTALLRPGRMEIQLEISLPNEEGRVQILNIHTAKMRECGKLDDDVDLEDIAKRTTNFSGAELEGLVRAAQSSAMNRLIKVGKNVDLDEEAVEKLKVTMEDFNYAIANDIKPTTVTTDSILSTFLHGELIRWSPEVDEILEIGQALASQPRRQRGLIKLLLTGAPNTGKTYLAAKIAKDTGFSVVKICRRESLIGLSDFAKCQAMHSLFQDAYKSTLSVVFIDNLEGLMGYTPLGQRFSNPVLQELLTLLNTQPPAGHRLLILATSSTPKFLQDVGLASRFSKIITVPELHKIEEFIVVVEQSGIFDDAGIQHIRDRLDTFDKLPPLGIKSLLELLDFVSILDNPPEAFILELQKLVTS